MFSFHPQHDKVGDIL